MFKSVKFDNTLRVYEDDTYVYDCERAVNARLGWVSIGIIAIIASVIVDLINIGQLLTWALRVSDDVLNNPFDNIKNFIEYLLPWITAISLTIAYLICGVYSGSFLRDYIAKRRKKSFIFFVCSLLIMIIFVIIITVFRANSEWQQVKGDLASLPYNPFILTLVYTGMMLIGAFVALAYGMNKNDPVAEEIAFQARTHFPSDQLIYDKAYDNFYSENYDEIKYDAEKRKYDRKKNAHVVNINKLMNRAHMIKDPSQANEIIALAKKVQESVLFNN